MLMMKGEPLPLGPYETDFNMHPSPLLIPPAAAMVAGFNDCGEEAIRYLMEVENLPADHPLVVGLGVHLAEQRKALDVAALGETPGVFSEVMPLPASLFDSSQSLVTMQDSMTSQQEVIPHMSDTDMLIQSLAEEIFSLLEEEDDGFYDDDEDDEDDGSEEMSYSLVENSLQATEQ